jgi:hypothetical protein
MEPFCNVRKTILVLAVVIVYLGLSISPKSVFAGSNSNSGSDGTIDGTNSATADFHHENGHGYDDSCPTGHSDTYCEAYTRAYRDQWAVLENSGNVHNNSFASSTDQNEAASVNIQGNNNNNKVNI